jgi:hypothetical protein
MKFWKLGGKSGEIYRKFITSSIQKNEEERLTLLGSLPKLKIRMTTGLLIIVTPEFKVYRGIPGFIDWRSHGRFSRFIKAGVYSGSDSEWLCLGEPLGSLVGTVVCGGCTFPSGAKDDPERQEYCKRWYKKNVHAWEKLHLTELRWGLSEEWQSFIAMWRPLFHNQEYVDVQRLKELEERNFYAGRQEKKSTSLTV